MTPTFDLLTLKLVRESHLRWGTFLPSLGILGLWVIELFAVYATDERTDKSNAYCPFPTGGGIITVLQSCLFALFSFSSSDMAVVYYLADRSFKYASPRLWNQLPDSFRQPHHSRLDSPPRPLVNPSLSSSQLSLSTTSSLFHSRLKTYLFSKSFPP